MPKRRLKIKKYRNNFRRFLVKLLSTPRRKPKRRIKKSLIIAPILVIVLFWSLFNVPKIMDNGKLKDLGYNKQEIKAIRDLKLTKTLIANKWYSSYLAASIKDKSINKDFIDLYLLNIDLSDKEFLLYSRLIDKGYDKETSLKIFEKLKYFEIVPLLVFDLQEDINTYIEDCLSNRESNSETHFILNNNYRNDYENPILSTEDNSYAQVLVNKKYHINSNYVPYQITPLSIQYASEGLQLSSSAAAALKEWCDKAISLKDALTGESPVRFYALSAYRDYNKQDELYKRYVTRYGQEEADALSARPGFSEHQTGLSVDLAAVGSEGISAFKDTEAYNWCLQNSNDFGFILRYPENKTSITGYDFEPWHFRYVGVEVAQALKASNLTYDEYYLLNLAPWTDINNQYPKPVETNK